MGQKPKKENIDYAVQDSNKGQTPCLVESEAYEKSYKSRI
jgi:hypothetical protein